MSLPDPHDGTGASRYRFRRFLRSKRRLLACVSAVTLALGLSVPLALTASAASASVSSNSGFETADGNLAVDSTFDWNGFAPTTWTGTAPYQVSDKVDAVTGWHFGGFQDAQSTTSDTAFAGGTKQDENCATVNTGKAPNKDDLKRIYLASKSVPVADDGGKLHTFLNLAWVRISQNTTSPSAHVGFEFNQGDTPCPGANSDGLVERTPGDMLIVYDFTGGSTDTPTITLRQWVDSGSCEVGSDSPPCTGYEINDTTTHTVTVDNSAKCSDSPYVGEEISFSDTPLTDITATATSEAPGGTQSTITCVNSSNADVGNSPVGPTDPAKVTANGLKPGTYTCTIVIDP